jgi:hypothetical protein
MDSILMKCKSINGKNVFLREVEVLDADFILTLRTHQEKGKHLSSTPQNLEKQIEWINEYKLRVNESYFIICDRSGRRLGCIRMYNPKVNSYCWGSWLLVDGLVPSIAIESILLIYAYGKFLNFKTARFDVRQENKSVWLFHETFMGAKLLSENSENRFYEMSEFSIEFLLKKYSHFLIMPLEIKGIR